MLSIENLRSQFPGRAIAPGDAGYDAARSVMLGGVDRHPAVVIRVADANEVARVIALARETGLELAVRSGGHSSAGHGTTEGGIVLDLSAMKAVEVDPAGRTVWAQAGLTAAELTAATHAHGLAVGFGDTGSVGIGGITLGGGIGYLVRKHGLTIDSLLAAEIVTAEGELLRVDAATHPDLFWAIRGGGGNFGVATRFQYRLHEVGTVVGGMLLLPASAETIAGFMAAAEAAPEELSTIGNVMPIPPMPFVPEEHHGELGILALMCWAGDVEAGERALAPFRTLAEPIADMVKPIPYPEIYPPQDPDYHPLAVAKTMFIGHVDLRVSATMLEHLRASDAEMRVVQLRPLGGASARVPADATAYAHRSSRILVNVAAFHDGTAADLAGRGAWVDGLVAALDQGEAGAYVNFIGDEGPARVRDAYPGTTWDRLVEIKRRYDPTNLFRLNQNLPPGARD
ncbi:MAG TPA: FAD-binding oxidoreductase [Candidatus Limnocylindria bacterium]|nr:FAD-binding oxidoreductase [Candidatus Limnocylindria bacterium]